MPEGSRPVGQPTHLWIAHCAVYSTLQWHSSENSKQIFPEKELRGLLSRNFHFVCEWFIYSHDQSAYSAMWPDPGNICRNRSQNRECGNWDWGHEIPFLGINKWDFRCSVWVDINNFSQMFYNVCAADFSLLNLPKGKSLGRSKPATNS
jgi:hypothetical protein